MEQRPATVYVVTDRGRAHRIRVDGRTCCGAEVAGDRVSVMPRRLSKCSKCERVYAIQVELRNDWERPGPKPLTTPERMRRLVEIREIVGRMNAWRKG